MRAKILKGYYLATPAFVFLDFFIGLNLRLPFLDSVPVIKYLYYAGVFAAGLYLHKNPARSAAWSATESLVSISLLIINFHNKILALTDPAVLGSGVNTVPPSAVICFAMSAAILAVAAYRPAPVSEPDAASITEAYQRRLRRK